MSHPEIHPYDPTPCPICGAMQCVREGGRLVCLACPTTKRHDRASVTVDLPHLRALLDGASPLPWTACRDGDCECGFIWHAADGVACVVKDGDPDAVTRSEGARRIDARLIVAAVNALPGLLERVERAESNEDAQRQAAVHAEARANRLERERDEARAERDAYNHAHEVAKRERDAWQDTAAQHARNRDYYRALVVECGEAIGEAAYTQDDGGRVEDVLCAKVPELVRELRLTLAAERGDPEGAPSEGWRCPGMDWLSDHALVQRFWPRGEVLRWRWILLTPRANRDGWEDTARAAMKAADHAAGEVRDAD